MTLSRKIAAAVVACPDLFDAPREVAVEEGPHRLTLHLNAAGAGGVAFDTLEFATEARPEWSPEALRGWGDRLTARLTYLMEPLVVLEHDPIDGQVHKLEVRVKNSTFVARARQSYVAAED